MRSIKSGGGPLICIARDMSAAWRGVRGNSLVDPGDSKDLTDYDRACEVPDHFGLIGAGQGSAFVLGDMPLETLVWRPQCGPTCIIRIFYADPGVDVRELLEESGDLDFAASIETMVIDIRNGLMSIFDSALSGDEVGGAYVEFEIAPGTYSVLTKQFEPDDRTSLLIHRFEQHH